MITSKKGTSIVEALVVMVMISLGLSGLFGIFSESQKLSESIEQRIQAIQIAREGLEAFENIRDTNWLLFGASLGNCWNVVNYNNACFSDSGTGFDIGHETSYKIYKDTSQRWILTGAVIGETRDFSDIAYRDEYRIRKDPNGFYTQSGGLDFTPIFTREIRITYIEDTNTDSIIDSNDEKIRVSSIVSWNDSSSTTFKTITLETELTNWKNYE